MSSASCKVNLSGGNIRNNHFYLRSCEDILPEGGIGGKSKADPGVPFQVIFDPGMTIETDVDGSKMILRNRQAVRDFFERSGAAEGDQVVLERTGDRCLLVRLQPAG